MPDKPRRKLRCAIYTRKSSDEGLEQDFNSLDAQREACEAYIVSQKHEGWTCLPDLYDDGGISGATMERPALQRLLADIKARKVDVVVVYKVDRLTRALADFAKIVEIFDAQSVSFVSVTQQFNTTSSMGRLTLNVLLSFAQFEREVTAERIRDKIAASKKKGMWMGGTVPLGYDAKDRTLVIIEPEAKTVRELFQLYLELGTVRQVTEEANRRGLRTKLREDLDSRMRGGLPFYRGHIYRILTNPLYIGQIQHKKDTYPGLHPAIIDQDTWDTVQQRMNAQRVNRRSRTTAKNPSPLAGKIFDDGGTPFTPSHAVKNGRRYRYYVEQAATRKPKTNNGQSYRRIPATEIEELTLDALTKMLRTPAEVLTAVGINNPAPSEMPTILSKATALTQRLSGEKSEAKHALLRDLIARVCVAANSVDIKISSTALCEHLNIADVQSISEDHAFEISVPATIKSRGTELKFVITDPAHRQKQNLDQTLIRAIVRAHAWVDEIASGSVEGLKTIALREKLNERYVRRILDLAFLAPDITRSILDGTQPENLMLQDLMIDGVIPLDWAEQKRLFRFA